MADNSQIILREFLKVRGIDAEIQPDEGNLHLIIIPTKQYYEHQQWLERWFKLVKEQPDVTYLHPRLRGSGDTDNPRRVSP